MDKIYYIETRGSCALRSAKDARQARYIAEDDVGRGDITDVRLATPHDIAWVKMMGGHVPEAENE